MITTWTRREVLKTIAATVATPVLVDAAPRRTVAIIGAGMAGVSVAWMLDGQRDVVLLESRDPATAAKLWKSWTTHRLNPPAQVLHQANFMHMLPTPASIQAQTNTRLLQGRTGLWFAGGYLYPYDAQETALLSAIEVANGLNGGSTPRGDALLASA